MITKSADESADTFNPFGQISDGDWLRYAGQTVAICPNEGRILASGSCRSDLAATMRDRFPGMTYNSLTFPFIDEISEQELPELLATREELGNVF
jgi:hypothetical protein